MEQEGEARAFLDQSQRAFEMQLDRQKERHEPYEEVVVEQEEEEEEEEEEMYDEFLPFSDEDDDESTSDEGSIYAPSPHRTSLPASKGESKTANKFKDGKEKQHCSSFVIEALKDGGDGKNVTVAQCKKYLSEQGLRSSGTKNVLIERIIAHINAQCSNGVSSCSGDSAGLVKSFEKLELHTDKKSIIDLIKDGVGEKKIKVDMCKAYLREKGLRLTGTKSVLLERIKEHILLEQNNGPSKYPEETFSTNCQGDACVGDVVLFKQRVYDMYNVGGRCATTAPVGMRTIAGRIIKESYGAAKQQHTFTIEVLWSTGERALPPLHPLIIKGRNLYRVKTLRQPWSDEESRKRQLQEKHARGAIARLERRMRVDGKPMHKHQGQNGERADRAVDVANSFTQVDGETQNKEIERASWIDPNPNFCENTMQVANQANVAGSICTVVLSLKRSLAGLIIGKGGSNSKEIMHISKADLQVEAPPEDPSLCIVRIRGTSEQTDIAINLVRQKVECKFFSKGCRHGDSCKFYHGLLQA